MAGTGPATMPKIVGVIGNALGARVQRDSQAERLLPGSALCPFERARYLPRRCLLFSAGSQFANVIFGPPTSLRSFLCHGVSNLKRGIKEAKRSMLDPIISDTAIQINWTCYPSQMIVCKQI